MKKLIKSILVILIFFTSACTKTDENEQKINYEEYLYNYNATVSNIERFYKFTGTAKTLDQGYELTVDLNPVRELATHNLELKIKYHVRYKLENSDEVINMSHEYNFLFSRTDSTSKTIINDMVKTKVVDLETIGVEIIEATGKIYTFRKVDFDTGFVINELQNKENYDKFIAAINKFENNLNINYINMYNNVSNKYTYDNQKTSSDSNSSRLKIILNPFYFESYAYGKRDIIREEDGKFYEFIIRDFKQGDLQVVDKYLVDESEYVDYMDSSDYLESMGFNEEEIDYKLIKIEILENFVLTGYLKDFLDEDTFARLLAIYELLGISESVLNNAKYEITLILKDNFISIETVLNIDVETNGLKSLEAKTINTIDFKEFTVYDLWDEDKYLIRERY